MRCDNIRMNKNEQSEEYRLSFAKKSNNYIYLSIRFLKIIISI